MQMAALYESITRSIIDELEKGVPTWVQPWRTKRRTALGLLSANLAAGRTSAGSLSRSSGTPRRTPGIPIQHG